MGDKHDEKAKRIAAFDKIVVDEGLYAALWHNISAALREATMAERARCAAIARAEFTSPGWSGAGECIATAIEKEPG